MATERDDVGDEDRLEIGRDALPVLPNERHQLKIVIILVCSDSLAMCMWILDNLSDDKACALVIVSQAEGIAGALKAELDSRNTEFPVIQAAEDISVVAGRNYIIPEDTYVSIRTGIFYEVEDPNAIKDQNHSDFFLGCVASEYGPRAVAVILTRRGAFTSKGIGAIHKAGGLVIVQDAAGAEALPADIASASVALPASEIVAALKEYRPRALPDHHHSYAVDGENHILIEIIELLRTSTAKDFSQYKQGTLQRRIDRRMAVLGISAGEFQKYLTELVRNEGERELLSKDLLIKVTAFFRDGAVFAFLRDNIIPEIVKAKALEGTIRLWVVGCSSGEEAYSLAILFTEEISRSGSNINLQIFASDADEEAISFARAGRYPLSAAKTIPAEFLTTYFSRYETGYSVKPILRSAIIFSLQNVLIHPPLSRIDMVSCRNVLIYLEAQARANVLSLFSFSLPDNALLLLGTSETVGISDDRYETISKTHRIYRRRGNHKPGDLAFNIGVSEILTAPKLIQTPGSAIRGMAVSDRLAALLAATYAPAAIVIDHKNQIVYSSGAVTKYLTIATGAASHDLFAMTLRDLHSKLRAAIRKVVQEGKPVLLRKRNTHSTKDTTSYAIHIHPLPDNGDSLLALCFIDTPHNTQNIQRNDNNAPGAARIIELEQEVDEARMELDNAVRKLELAAEVHRAVNAESLALNEEFQSNNEELFASKEELQSLNEELTVLNGQLHDTLERERTTSDDLESLLYSTDVPTIFLDNDLNIRFFTPATRSLFNIIISDVGRPIADLSSLVRDGTLVSDAVSVLAKHGSLETETRTRDGSWYVRITKPYRTQDGNFGGVVITFIEISAQKRVAEAREAAKQAAETATEAKSNFLAAASHDLRQPLQTLKLLQGLLEKSAGDEQSQVLILRLEETLASMSDILNTVLELNQIEAGTFKTKLENFAVNDLLTRMLKEFNYLAQAKGIELRVVPCRIAVRTDARFLEQILRNLISNALKYTVSGRVLIGCRRYGRFISLQIWDTGVGIAENHLETIFTAYHQLDPTSSAKYPGQGLGLSIVRRLCDLLGLEVRLSSQAGSGSVFSVEIPQAGQGDKLVQLSAPSTRDDFRYSPITGSILIIEDEAPVRELLKVALEQEGYRTIVAASGPIAIRIVEGMETPPTIILADYHLSQSMDGLTAVKNIRKAVGREIPAVILTGDTSQTLLEKFARDRIPHLTKPVTLKEVMQSVDSLLGKPSLSLTHKILANNRGEAEHHRIFVIDDDESICCAIRSIFEKLECEVITFATAEDYLANYNADRQGCLLLDAYLPGMNGLELLHLLKQNEHRFPIIVITGQSDVKLAVDAMKLGAFDFIEKPLSAEELQLSVFLALEQSLSTEEQTHRQRVAQEQLAGLTPRQREILTRVIQGQPNKIIAADLGLSQRTVENHRASIMRRTNSRSLPMLVRLVAAAGS